MTGHARRVLAVVPALMILASAAPVESRTALPKPYVSADQGGTAYAPENTMMAMRNGIRLGADELEADLNITSDGHLVLVHDGSLDRTTNCTGNVHEHTLAQVRRCDAAYWWVPGKGTLVPGAGAVVERDASDVYPLRGRGVRIPTAHEFFSYVRALGRRAPQVTVEIKNIPYDTNFDPVGQRMADVLVPLLKNMRMTRRTIVESFWPTSIERVKELDPSVRTLFLTLGSATVNRAYVATSATDVSSSDILAPDFGQAYVDAVHALGRQVVPWLVESRADWDEISSLGVDGVLTSTPACILLAMGRKVPRPYVTPEAGLSRDVPACAASTETGHGRRFS